MFPDLLKSLRIRKGITQGQLATAIGVSPGNVGDWETGKSKPGYVALTALTRYFEVSADELLELEHAKSSRSTLYCDGVPLTESEADLLAMYRLLDAGDRKTIFDLTKLKYEQMTGEKESIYSTYSDTNVQQENGPGDDGKMATGTA